MLNVYIIRKLSIQLISTLAIILLNVAMLNAQEQSPKIKIFMEGELVDYNFLRRNLNFVEFVNDQAVSNVHILVTKQKTGSGGSHFYFGFNSKSSESIRSFALNCITYGEDTEEVILNKMLETLKSGLIPFVNENQVNYAISVEQINSDNTEELSQNPIKDPWNYWVFSLGLGSSFEAEEQRKEYGYGTEIEADRVTELWRLENGYQFEKEELVISKIQDSVEQNIHTYNLNQKFNSKIAYSISNHWSLGLYTRLEQSTYENMKFYGSLKPTIEYNFFPWSQSHQKVFTLGYSFGPQYFSYYEKTIFDKMDDFLMMEQLKAQMEITEKWGKLEIKVEAGHYFPDFEFYYLKSQAEISIRVARGLFIEFGIEANNINNQIYLPASELSDDELLLNTRKLPTTFEIDTWFGIRFQFGSIYNSVVNQRL